ncbi:uncharacterized protein LOC113858151 [Abrus precatorius]|uniref:Uncharacterized protein LOC113858151 n=1 Tax=Abrus precatorius TaxID=3816 RepID=A0A8B8KRF5_ABRPR|nr:uncharacterized protein LOC113858151 [Abrus precatorius]
MEVRTTRRLAGSSINHLVDRNRKHLLNLPRKRKMEKQGEKGRKSESEKESLEGLPMKDSPYLQYKDLEEYKSKGYGTQGHQEPNQGRGAGATEAPTLSGAAVSSESQFAATDAINRQGVP